MAAKKKLVMKSDDPDRFPVMWDIVNKRVKNHFGIQMKVKEPDKADIAKLMEKAKKPFELSYVVDKSKFSVELQVGSKLEVLGTFDLASEKDVVKRREMLQNLANFELVTDAELAAFDKANPDPKVAEAAKSDLRRLEMDLQGDLADRKTIAAFTKYDTGGRAGGWDMTAHLKNWIKEKRPSWLHYIEFVEDVDAGKDAKQTFDHYAKDGAQYPINLPPAIQGPLEKAIAAGNKPDFKPARGLIVKMIDAKFIPPFRKERLALYDKDIKEMAQKLKGLKQKVGAK
jgi:hypothetical protein